MPELKDRKEAELLDDLADKSAELARKLFPGATDEVYEAFGSEVANKMAVEWGGDQFYFPKDTIYRVAKLHQDVWAAFNGRNHDQLVKQFRISKVWVYHIIKRMRSAEMASRQPSLFPSAQE